VLRQGLEKGLPISNLMESWDFLQVRACFACSVVQWFRGSGLAGVECARRGWTPLGSTVHKPGTSAAPTRLQPAAPYAATPLRGCRLMKARAPSILPVLCIGSRTACAVSSVATLSALRLEDLASSLLFVAPGRHLLSVLQHSRPCSAYSHSLPWARLTFAAPMRVPDQLRPARPPGAAPATGPPPRVCVCVCVRVWLCVRVCV